MGFCLIWRAAVPLAPGPGAFVQGAPDVQGAGDGLALERAALAQYGRERLDGLPLGFQHGPGVAAQCGEYDGGSVGQQVGGQQ